MEKDIYEKLARHLDSLPGGYPKTESGVELRILRRLFTPEDAALALSLSLIAEEPRVIARRAGIAAGEIAGRLADMDKRGLVLAIRREGAPVLYMAQQFIVGIWEAQVNRLSRELIEDFEEYAATLFDVDTWKKAPQLRTIPVNRSIDAKSEIMPYEQAEELVGAKESFAVSNCICRQEQQVMGKGCGKPLESCLQMGTAAESLVRLGRGRAISREEAIEILHRAEKAGLVLQPSNAKDALFICMCCGCCCGVLKGIKRHPKPASVVSSPFFAKLDGEMCKGCGACVKRCQMEALSVKDDKAALDADRCIGCGLCVTTCPTSALSLARKTQQPYLPGNIVETYIRLGRARGKMGITRLIGMQLKSKLDRLLAHKRINRAG